MATWREIAAAEPEVARAVQALFDAHRHKTLATTRQDGSPRISGIEAVFVDGNLWFEGWADSRKVRDLSLDPRVALHGGTAEPSYEGNTPTTWTGDAKVAGRAVEVTDPATIEAVTGRGFEPGQHRQYRVDLTEVVLTQLSDSRDYLVIDAWHADRGLRHFDRR